MASATLGLLGSEETVWLRGDFCLGFLAVLTVTVIEITIARIISMNKIGSLEIKLTEIGRTGWIVGVFGEMWISSVDEVACKFGIYCSLSIYRVDVNGLTCELLGKLRQL